MSNLGAQASDAPLPLAAVGTDAYRTLLTGGAALDTTAASGNIYSFRVNSTDTTFAAVSVGAGIVFPFLYLAAADLAVAGLTTKLNLRAWVVTGASAPARTITVGLYPLTSASSAFSPGTVVPGSTVAFASPAANGTPTDTSGDLALPSDGLYAPGVIVSGTPSGAVHVGMSLRYRNVP
jgi:hypothetical protein